MKCNQSRPGFELVSPCPFPTTITITPRTPHIIYSHNTTAEHNQTLWLTSMNERSHTLFLRGWCSLCVRDELETGTDCYIDPKFFFDHTSTSFSSWLGCSTVGLWGPKALCLPLALISASCLQLTRTVCALVVLLFNVHLLPLIFRLFTQVLRLIDGSFEGQYITHWQ